MNVLCPPCMEYILHAVSLMFVCATIQIYLTLGAHAQRGLRYLSCVCVCVCVCVSHRANLRTGASRRLTEGTSGLSGTFFTKVKRRFL